MSEEQKGEAQTIIRLQVENFMRLKAVELSPGGKPIIIGGANNAGKTSVLKAIEAALGGERHLPDVPIREGEEKAVVILETERYIITRSFTGKGSYINIKTKEGYIVPSPQKLLDEVVGDLTFDPLLVLQMKPKQQVDFVKQIACVDFTALDEERAKKYEERRDVGRDLGAKLIPEAPAKPEAEMADVSTLLAQLEEAEKRTSQYTVAKDELKDAETALLNAVKAYTEQQVKVQQLINDLNAAKSKLLELDDVGKEAKMRVKDAREKTFNTPEPIDTAVLRHSIAEVTQHNTEFAAYEQQLKDYQKLVADRQELANKQEALTARIDEIDAEKLRLLKESNLPVDGLTFDDNGLYLDRVPFDQASDSQKLKVSVALAMALNPQLRVMLVNNGSELDEENLGLLLKLAEEFNCQAWIVRVSRGDECSVIIEDGMVQDTNSEEEPDELSV